jgi:phosphoribosylanthranilate isomerase
MTKIKICGVTRPDDAAHAAAAGADFLGLNFWPHSKRYLAADRARAVAAAARAAGSTQLVGVFVNATLYDITAIVHAVGLDVIQLHGDETPDDVRAVAVAADRPVWKAIAVAEAGDLADFATWPVTAFLLDAPTAGRGGAGKAFDWTLARDARQANPAHKLVLAGGLGPHNVAAAIKAVAPWAVDVASGVESAPGVKDPAKVAAFVAAARSMAG